MSHMSHPISHTPYPHIPQQLFSILHPLSIITHPLPFPHQPLLHTLCPLALIPYQLPSSHYQLSMFHCRATL
jgi:hypothetical protein